jgi:hypothetical protein
MDQSKTQIMIRRPANYKLKVAERNARVNALTDKVADMALTSAEASLALDHLGKYLDLGAATAERGLAALGIEAEIPAMAPGGTTVEAKRERAVSQLKLLIAAAALLTDEVNELSKGAGRVFDAADASHGGLSDEDWRRLQPHSLATAAREVERLLAEEDELSPGTSTGSTASPAYQGSSALTPSFGRPPKPSGRRDASSGFSGSAAPTIPPPPPLPDNLATQAGLQ